MSKEIKDLYRKALKKGASNIAVPKGNKGVHTKAFHLCTTEVAKSGSADNPYAVCMAKLGKDKAVKKAHRKVARPE
jgi:hypothetical protein